MGSDRETLFILCFVPVKLKRSAKSKMPQYYLQHLSTLQSDSDSATYNEASKFKTIVTNKNIEISFELDCTGVTMEHNGDC